MLVHGFSIDMMVELVNGGLASVTTEPRGRRPPTARGCLRAALPGRGGQCSAEGVESSATPPTLLLATLMDQASAREG